MYKTQIKKMGTLNIFEGLIYASAILILSIWYLIQLS